MRIIVLFIVGLSVSCGVEDYAGMRRYYEHELSRRRAVIRDVSPADTSVLDNVLQRTAALVLLSKDSENARAARVRSAMLFDSLCRVYNFQRSDFPDLHEGLTLMETEIQLRENMLAFADRFVMEKDTLGVHMTTAH